MIIQRMPTTTTNILKIDNIPDANGFELLHNPNATKVIVHVKGSGGFGSGAFIDIQASMDRVNWVNVNTAINTARSIAVQTLAPYYRIRHNNTLGSADSTVDISIGN